MSWKDGVLDKMAVFFLVSGKCDVGDMFFLSNVGMGSTAMEGRVAMSVVVFPGHSVSCVCD